MRLLIADVPYTNGLPEQLVSSLVWNGQPGVQIFFVVSGFLITATTLRRWGTLSRVSLRGFYLMRFARIVPLLLLLLSVLTILHLGKVKYFVVSPKTGGLGRALIAALTFHVNVLEARRGYLPGSWDILWSLSVEESLLPFLPTGGTTVRTRKGPHSAAPRIGRHRAFRTYRVSAWQRGLERILVLGLHGCHRPRLSYGSFAFAASPPPSRSLCAGEHWLCPPNFDSRLFASSCSDRVSPTPDWI